MTTPPLDPDLTEAALHHLGIAPAAPTLDLLDELLTTYTRTVPWESASRIAKRARTPDIADCPRWPVEFWTGAIERGTGGTCFESNYAFFSLLRALGYEGYLTVNDMKEVIGCHAAIIVMLDGARWLVDVGMPLYRALPFGPGAPQSRRTPFHTYTVRPVAPDRYEIERDAHPNPNCFTLIDRPISDAAYRTVVTDDYLPSGNFNDHVIVTKVIGDEIWRFYDALAHIFESFVYGGRKEHPLTGDVAAAVADRFGIDKETVRASLRAAQA